MMKTALSNRSSVRKNVRSKRTTLVAIAGATSGLVGASAYAQTYTPIGITAASYNFSVIVPATASQTAATKSINSSMDGGTGNLATNVWFEKGYCLTSLNSGVPVHGSTFTSLAGSSHIFTMPASYGNGTTPTNDVLFTGNTANSGADTTPSATFNFNTSGSYSAFSILTGTSSGPMTFSAIVNYVNGSTQTISGLSSPDWFGTGTEAYNASGRCSPSATTTTSFSNLNSTQPDLWQVDVTGLLDTIDPIKSVTVTTTSTTSKTSMFAISGVVANTVVFTGTDLTTPGTFDTTSQNFSFNGGPASFNSSDNVLFNDTATTAPNGGNVVIASGGVSPLSVAFANNAITYNLSGGSIAGTGPVFINGGGTVNFAQLNTYTGQTNISSGTLNVASTGSIGAGSLYFGSTGALNLANANQSIGSLNGAGAISLAGTNLYVGSGGVASTTITGTGNLIYAGTQTLTGSSSYVGSTTFNTSSTSLTISSPAAFGAAANSLVFKSGSTLSAANALTVATSNPIPYSYSIASGGTLNFGGAFNMDLTGTGTLGGATTLSVTTAGTVVTAVGPILGGATIVKTGAGTFYLANTSNAIAATNISAGVLEFASGALGAPGTPINLLGGTILFAPGNTEDITSDHVFNLNAGGGTINTNGNNVLFAGSINGVSLGAFIETGPVVNPGSLTVLTNVKPTNGTFEGGSPATPNIITFNGSTAVYSQTSTSNGLNIGQNTGDYVIFNISNGAQFSILGGDANGGLNLADQANSASSDSSNACTGIINIIGSSSVFYSTSQLFIGKAFGSNNVASGTINLFSGTLNAPSATLVTQLGSNVDGYGYLNVSGGAAYVNLVQLGAVSGAYGAINLSGGTLSASNISGGAGTSKIYFNGGVLNANSNYVGTTAFISAISSAQIQAGGLTITTYNVSAPSTPLQTNSNLLISANLSSGTTGSPDGGLTFNSGTGNLTLSGNDSYTGPTNLSGNLSFTQAGATTLLGNISSSSPTAFLTQSGAGTTILGGTDTFPGGVNISAGVLQLNLGASLGASAINLTGGALGIGADSVLNGYTLNNSGGAIQFNNYTSFLNFPLGGSTSTNLRLGAANGSSSTLAGNISGAENLIYIGPGTLILGGTNAYTGYTNVSGGYLNFTANNLGTGPVTLNGGVLQYATGNTQDLTTTQGLTLAAGASGIDVGTNNVTFAGNVSNGSLGSLTKYGVGTLTLQGNLASTGVYVRAGTFSLLGPAANASSTAFTSVGLNPGDVGTFTMDQGAKFVDGAGFNIADASSTTGAVNTGVFNIADSTNQGTTLTTASFYVGKGSTGTNYNNAVGTVNQTGGTVRLSAASGAFDVGLYGTGTYNQSGGNVSAGAVTIGANAGSIGVYNLNGGTLLATQVVGGSGTGTLNFNGGTLKANASSTTFVSGLTTAAIGLGGAKINTNTFNETIPQVISSGVTLPALDGGLTKLGTGTLTLPVVNTYSGGTVVNGGIVVASKTGALGAGPITLGGGTLVLSNLQTTTTTGTSAFTQINVGGSFVPSNTGTTLNLTGSGFGGCNTSTYIPVTINDNGSFSGSFNYVHTTGTAGGYSVADGISFGFQNDPRGLSALGAAGGGEGYSNASGSGITNSAVGFIDLYNYQYGNGSNGNLNVTTTDTTLPSTSGQLITFAYNGLTKTFSTSIAGTDTTTQVVDLAKLFGGTAGGTGNGYVGFSAGTGGVTATQSLTNVVLTSIVPSSVNLANAVLTSPGTTSTFTPVIYPGVTNTSVGTLSLGAGSTLDITANGSSGTGYTVTTGAVTLSGTDTLDVANPTSGGGSGNVLLGALNDGGVASTLAVQDAGIVTLTGPGSLTSASTVTIAGGTALALNNATALGSASLFDNGTLTLGAGIGNTTVNFGGPYFNNVILNGNLLTINAPGTLAALNISAGTTAGGSVNIASGTVTYTATFGYTGPTGVASGATLILGATQSFAGLNGGGNVVLNGTTLTVGNSTSNLSSGFSGIISDGTASGGLTVGGTGVLSLNGVNTYTGLTTVNSGATLNVYGALASAGAVTTSGTVNFEANTSGGIYNRSKGILTINTGGLVTVGFASPRTGRTFLTVSGLSIAGAAGAYSGTLDLSNNDLDVQGGALGTINGYVAQGYAGGSWQGPGGILSTAAASDSKHLTALGVIVNSYNVPGGGVAPLYGVGASLGLFDGANPAVTDVLVKYTYYGDTNLDGKVDGSDYSNIDAGFMAAGTLSGWANGDFNYDGVINGSDYTLIDNAFNSQGAALTASVATPSALVGGGGSAVPEPTSLGLLAIGAVGLLGRRRSHR